VIDLEAWGEGMFQLCWTQHGGSGLGCSVTEALDLQVGDRDWLLERVAAQREQEAQALRKASKGT